MKRGRLRLAIEVTAYALAAALFLAGAGSFPRACSVEINARTQRALEVGVEFGTAYALWLGPFESREPTSGWLIRRGDNRWEPVPSIRCLFHLPISVPFAAAFFVAAMMTIVRRRRCVAQPAPTVSDAVAHTVALFLLTLVPALVAAHGVLWQVPGGGSWLADLRWAAAWFILGGGIAFGFSRVLQYAPRSAGEAPRG